MAVQLIPNQLVKLYDTETLNQRNKRLTLDYRTYCQIVREEQTTMFQVRLLPDSENLITNGDFHDNISNWSVLNQTWQWASGRLQGMISNNTNPQIAQQISTNIGKTYKLSGTIQFANISSSVTIVASQGGIPTWVFDADDYGTQPFDFGVFFVSDLAHVDIIFFLSGNQRDIVYIDNIELYELSEPTVSLEDCNGQLVKTIPVFDRSNDYLTYAVDWFGLDEGCYRICISGIDDTEDNLLDRALALGTEGNAPIELEEGGYLRWF